MSCFRLVEELKGRFPVKMMCDLLDVSRSGFYEWRSREPSERQIVDQMLTELILEIHDDSEQTYGAPRIKAELADDHGISVGTKRVARLMRSAEISGIIKVKKNGQQVCIPGVRTAPDLVDRDFYVIEPNRFWVADITYIRTWEGWVYLAAVMDLFSRRIVGWSVANHMRADLVVDALEMAVAARNPAPGLVHHSDRGSQYTALVFNQRCRKAGIEVSMGGRSAPHDNAVAESFFSTIKKECIHRQSWRTREEVRAAIFHFIEVRYNQKRRHSTLGMKSPAEFERMHELELQEALAR